LFDERARRSLLQIYARSNENLEKTFGCKLAIEGTARGEIFRPLSPMELKDCLDLLKQQNEKLIQLPLLMELADNRVPPTLPLFRPHQLSNRLGRLAENLAMVN
jgi:hypothetical protein